MRRPRLSVANLTTVVLVGSWSALALGLGTILPSPRPDGHLRSQAPLPRQALIMMVHAAGADPCTGEHVVVEARLTIEITRQIDAGIVTTTVDVRLENDPSTEPTVEIAPLRRPVALDAPRRIDAVRTPLAGRHHNLDLVVDLQEAVADREAIGGLVVSPGVVVSSSACHRSARQRPADVLSARWRGEPTQSGPS